MHNVGMTEAVSGSLGDPRHNSRKDSVLSPTTVDWGAAVHGSSEFLKATSEPELAASCASRIVPTEAASRDGSRSRRVADPPSYCKRSWENYYHGTCKSDASDKTGLGASSSYVHPVASYITWQQQQSYLNPQQAFDPYTQQCRYQCPENTQQYAWQSYHAHIAIWGESAPTACGASDVDGWKGWVSYCGDRASQHQLSDLAINARQQSVDPDAASGAGAGAGCERAAIAAPPGLTPSIEARPPCSIGGATSASGAGGENYDPMLRAQDTEDAADPPAPTGPPPSQAAAAAPPSQADAPGDLGRDMDRSGTPEAQPLNPLSPETSADPAAPEPVDLIVVWDLDETLIIFNSLLSGAFVQAVAAAHGHGATGSAAAVTAAAKVAPSPAAELPAVFGQDGGRGDGPLKQQQRQQAPSAAVPPPLSARAVELGQQLADLVFSLCDDHLAFRLLDTSDPLTFAELWAQVAPSSSPSDPGDTGSPGSGNPDVVTCKTLQHIAEVYAGGSENLHDVIGQADHRTLTAALAEAERLTDGWVEAARRLLAGTVAVGRAAVGRAAVQAGAQQSAAWGADARDPGSCLPFRHVRHVLVSAGHLVATLGKLLLWGLDEFFDIRDVYSASGRPKLEAFRTLRARHGPLAAYVAVGDGPEEERAAAALGWGFIRVALTEAGETASCPQPALSVMPGGGDGAATAGGGPGAGLLGAGASAGEAPAADGPPGRVDSLVRRMPRQQARALKSIRPEDLLAAARSAYLRY